MRKSNLPPLLLALLSAALLLAPACAVAAGAVAGYVLYKGALEDNSQIAHVTIDKEEVWATAQTALQELGATNLVVRTEPLPRTATCMLDKSELTVEVEAFDLDHTIVRVRAVYRGMVDGETSERVLRGILERLSPSANS